MISLTIITATIGRPTLRDTMESVASQMEYGDEHLIVFDADEDADFRIKYPPSEGTVSLLGHQDPESIAGNAQRNHALANCAYGYVLYVDDDCVLAPFALSSIRSKILEEPLPWYSFASQNGDIVYGDDSNPPIVKIDRTHVHTNINGHMIVHLHRGEEWWKKELRYADTDFVVELNKKYGPPGTSTAIISLIHPKREVSA